MKSDKLKLFIRKIVREEVAMAINEVITELKQPVNAMKTEPQQQKPIVENKKTFSNNNILNDILNETAQANTSLDSNGNFMDESSVQLNEGAKTNLPDFLNKNYSDVVKKSYTKKGKTIGAM
jgi:hypothetical protein